MWNICFLLITKLNFRSIHDLHSTNYICTLRFKKNYNCYHTTYFHPTHFHKKWDYYAVFKNWVARQSAQLILIFKRFSKRWRQKGENDEATHQQEEENSRKRSRNE